ncbi:Collagen alpha-2(V) chain [Homalodisca vitripennis]|nr:Collagen alpha-2(V) chain [Homalodisca vitripennis]KAG8331558.1 Collagen alpha-2(V) chain [Homalodisca vitripennis]
MCLSRTPVSLKLNKTFLSYSGWGGRQARKPEWGRTTISYSTDKSLRLPITDIALRDIGKSDQSFWLEIGMACFK